MAKARLSIPCPVCIDRGITRNLNTARIINWVHSTDDGALYVDESGHISCDYCSHKWFIGDSRWGCRDHSGSDSLEYAYASGDATALAVARAAAKFRNQMSAYWFTQLLDSINW